MKHLKLALIPILILMLTSCVSNDEKNIHEFIKLINSQGQAELTAEDFKITKDNGLQYSYMADENTLITLYSDESGGIFQCSVTSDGKSNLNRQWYTTLTKCLSGLSEAECENAIEAAQSSGQSTLGIYLITYRNYKIGNTLIINRKDAVLNTNNEPTLKDHIENDDISRPTLSDNDITATTTAY